MEKTLPVKPMTVCPICGAEDGQFALEAVIGELRVMSCSCGMKFLNPYLAEEGMREVYENERLLERVNSILRHYYSFYHAYKGTRTHRIYLRALDDLAKRKSLIYSKITKKLRTSGKKLLDIGSGNGIFLEVAKSKGWDAEGIDSSPENVAFAKSKGLSVTQGSFETAVFPKEHFDVITLWDVIEHTSDPLGLIGKCFETLKAGGHILIATPNERNLPRLLGNLLYKISGGKITGPLEKIFVLEHTLYFNPETLCTLLGRFDFDVKRIIYDYTDLKRYRMNPILKIVAQILFWISLPVKLSNRMIVIARKKVDVGS